jgi:hypothetical protein
MLLLASPTIKCGHNINQWCRWIWSFNHISFPNTAHVSGTSEKSKIVRTGCWRDYFILLGVLFLFSLALFGEQEESRMTTYNSSAAYNWASSLGMLHKTRESQTLKSPITEDFNDQKLRLSESTSAQNYIMDVTFVWPWTGHKFQFRSRWKSWQRDPIFQT